jgi:hypothetical protein
MVKHIKLSSAEDLRVFMNLAWHTDSDIGVHTTEGQIADAKSILGLIALDYSKPVMVVTEDESFFDKIKKWTVEE